MKQWSKGYEALRIYVRFAFWLTHKRIVVIGKDQIPQDQPIIFAANHQNALMDPLALVCTNPLQTLWLARADIFKSKFTQPILKFMKMVPIYRIRDGKDNLANNEQIFNQVTQVLESKQSIALFPEAAHSGKRKMLQHKKAIPRIALEAEEKNNFQLGLQIVPVGIYYDHYWNFNRTLIVQYGNAIGIDKYQTVYAENPQNAMLALRDEIHDILEPLTLQINSDKYYVDYENIRMVAGEEFAGKLGSLLDKSLQLFRSDQKLIKKIEQLEIDSPGAFEELISKTGSYIKVLGHRKISNNQVVKAKSAIWLTVFLQLAGALLSLPLLAFGLLFNFIPYLIPRVILTRKVKDPAFRSTFIFVAGLLLFPVFYLIEGSIIWIAYGSAGLAFLIILLMPFAGKLAFRLLMFDKDLLQTIRLKFFQKRLFGRLIQLRSEILGFNSPS